MHTDVHTHTHTHTPSNMGRLTPLLLDRYKVTKYLSIYTVPILFFFPTEVKLLYNVVLVSAIQ